MSSPHAESLLQIPLFAWTLASPAVRIVRRGVDARWRYHGVISRRCAGFNPFAGQVLVEARSQLARYLDAPHRSARALNSGDRLVEEALFAVHDALHAWAYGRIRALAPALALGRHPMDPARREALAFAHLVTEAVATVGLDYWCLASGNLDEMVPIGTALATLTIRYHRRHDAEYCRWNPRLEVGERSFFSRLVHCYATGRFRGFRAADVARSPLTERWLRHELAYGKLQRRYIREWLAYLAGRATVGESTRPVAYAARWQGALVEALAGDLHRLTSRGQAAPVEPIDPAQAWRSPRTRFDPRFINLALIDDSQIARRARELDGEARGCAIDQWIAGRDWDAFDHDKLARLIRARADRAIDTIASLLRREPRLSPSRDEPRDLLLLG